MLKHKIKYLSIIALVSVFSCISDNSSNIPKPSPSTIVESPTPTPVVSYLPSPSSTPYVEERKYRGDINYYAEITNRPKFSPDGKKIAYLKWISSLTDFGGDIGGSKIGGGGVARLSVMNVDGTNSYSFNDKNYDIKESFNILWLSNKEQLFFKIDSGSYDYNIHLLDLENKKLLDIADNKIYYHPTISYDDSKIAYTSETGNISILNLKDKSIKDLNIQGNQSSISPDGSKIVFLNREDSKKTFLYSINSDGTKLKKLEELFLDKYTSIQDLKWSPDSKKISYLVNLETNIKSIPPKRQAKKEYSIDNYTISIINPENGSKVIFSKGQTTSNYFSWSPDSKRIVYSEIKGENGQIFIKDVDGSNLVQLTNNEPKEFNDVDFIDNVDPDWSSDGKKIVFSSNKDGFFPYLAQFLRNGLSDIYIIDSDGTNLKRLTTAKYSRTEK